MKKLENVMKNPQLDGESFFFEGNEIGVALFHGFTATTAEVRPLAEYLRSFGYTLSAPLLPGHGIQPADLNQTSWMDWYESAESTYLGLRERCTKVFVGGESMGALLALLIASRYQKVDGIIAASPALMIRGIGIARLAQRFIQFQAKNQAEDNLPWKGYDVYPVRGLAQLAKLQKVVRKELGNIDQPLLVFMGGKDTSILPKSGQVIMDAVSSTDKQLVFLPESPHVLLLAQDREHVFEKVQEFMRGH